MGSCKCCSYEQNNHKDFIRGGVDESDFDEATRYRRPKRRTKKARARSLTRTPCPVAEDGKHVYIWAPYESEWSSGKEKVFYRYFGYHKYEQQVCCGCLAKKGYRRETERYSKVKERKWIKLTGGEFSVKRGEPVGRYMRWGGNFYSFTWESYNEGYLNALAEWERSQEAKAFEYQAMLRRLDRARNLLGYN